MNPTSLKIVSFKNFAAAAVARCDARTLYAILFTAFAAMWALVAFSPAALAQQKRALSVDDLAKMRDVRDPQCSPDGKWVAYMVSTVNTKDDKHTSHIWMVRTDGSQDIQVTQSQESESGPEWSPDGKYLSFTSSRPGPAKGGQVWLLSREGVRRSS